MSYYFWQCQGIPFWQIALLSIGSLVVAGAGLAIFSLISEHVRRARWRKGPTAQMLRRKGYKV